MSKRTSGKFARRKNDTYDTPEKAILPLIPHLPKTPMRWWEPCAGAGMMRDAICKHWTDGRLALATDIDPRGSGIVQADAMQMRPDVDLIISNPPWTRQLMHPLIEHLCDISPTWLLFDADWIHTKQAAPYLGRLVKVVSVGRVSWMENGTSGLDNCAWHLFDARHIGATRFFGRAA